MKSPSMKALKAVMKHPKGRHIICEQWKLMIEKKKNEIGGLGGRYTIDGLASIFKIHKNTIYHYIKHGLLHRPTYKKNPKGGVLAIYNETHRNQIKLIRMFISPRYKVKELKKLFKSCKI